MSLAPRCPLAADIGADHAFLTVELIRRGICSHVLCTDLSAPSLEKAKRTVSSCSLEDSVTFFLGDGLAALGDERPELIVIAGMGGETISAILSAEEPPDALYLLQPMSRAERLRRHLYENGFEICSERLAEDDGRIYPVLAARYDGVQRRATPLEYLCGARHLAPSDEPLRARYLTRIRDSLSKRKLGRQTAGLPTSDEEALLFALDRYLS